MKNKKILIFIAVILTIAIGAFVYYKISNSKYLFKAYLEEHNGNYTLVIKNKDYFSFNEMWKIEDAQMDNGHIKVLPWVLDNRANKITKVDIQDNIKIRSISFWFYNLNNLKEIVGLEKIDTSELVSMSATFKNCSSLEEIDLGNFNLTESEIIYIFASSTASILSDSKYIEMFFLFDNDLILFE